MFKQLNFVVFLCLISHVSFMCAVPKARFTPPSSFFSLGKEFTAACTISGVESTGTYLYYVNFFLNSTSSFNVHKVALVVGFWTGSPDCPTCAPTFAAPDNLALLGLKAAAGPKGTYPQFEIKITPLDAKAYGTYFCAVKIEKIKNDSNPTEYMSNYWQVKSGHFGLLPSVVTLIVATFVLTAL